MIELCNDLVVIAVLDTHLTPASVAHVVLCESLDHFFSTGKSRVIMTPLGAEEIMEIRDPLLFGNVDAPLISLTGRDGTGRGCWYTVITGRNDRLGYCETTIRLVALLSHCGFNFFEYPDRVAISCDRKSLEVPLRKLKTYAHGYALLKYDSDNRAVAKYTVQNYLDATYKFDVRSTVIFQTLTQRGGILLPALKEEAHR